jgi:hypothetical protein
MPSHKRKPKLGSMVLGAVKVCKLEGKKKKLVCRTVAAHDRLGSMVLGSTVLNGAKSRRKAARRQRDSKGRFLPSR